MQGKGSIVNGKGSKMRPFMYNKFATNYDNIKWNSKKDKKDDKTMLSLQKGKRSKWIQGK